MSDYVEQLDNILRATGEEVLTMQEKSVMHRRWKKQKRNINAIRHKLFPPWRKNI